MKNKNDKLIMIKKFINIIVKKNYYYIYLFHIINTDDAFSIETGLERDGIAGPVRCLWTLGSSTKTRNIKDQRGLACCLSDA